MPGSGYGNEHSFQYVTARLRMAVTALKAGWAVSSSFFPAETNLLSAPKVWAAWSFWVPLSDLWTPSQVKLTRAAVMVFLRRSLALVVSVDCEDVIVVVIS